MGERGGRGKDGTGGGGDGCVEGQYFVNCEKTIPSLYVLFFYLVSCSSWRFFECIYECRSYQ
jgi:hypothetical protein